MDIAHNSAHAARPPQPRTTVGVMELEDLRIGRALVVIVDDRVADVAARGVLRAREAVRVAAGVALRGRGVEAAQEAAAEVG